MPKQSSRQLLQIRLLELVGLSMILLGVILFAELEHHKKNEPPTPAMTPWGTRQSSWSRRRPTKDAFASFEAKVRLESMISRHRHYLEKRHQLLVSSLSSITMGTLCLAVELVRRRQRK